MRRNSNRTAERRFQHDRRVEQLADRVPNEVNMPPTTDYELAILRLVAGGFAPWEAAELLAAPEYLNP